MAETDDNSRGVRHGAPFFFILAWAGLAGAAGVALSAVAAHKVDSPALATAATILTLHAAAAVGLCAISSSLGRPNFWRGVTLLMLAAASLFSGEIAFYTLTGNAAFQMLAPVGGTLMIASWLAVAALAVVTGLRRR